MISNGSRIEQTLFYCQNLAAKHAYKDSCSHQIKARLLLAAQVVVNAIAIPIILLLGLAGIACGLIAATLIAADIIIGALISTAEGSIGNLLSIPISLLGILSPETAIEMAENYRSKYS